MTEVASNRDRISYSWTFTRAAAAHAARSKAKQRLVQAHAIEYTRYLEEERKKLGLS